MGSNVKRNRGDAAISYAASFNLPFSPLAVVAERDIVKTCEDIVEYSALLCLEHWYLHGLRALGALLLLVLIFLPLKALGQATFKLVAGTEVTLLKDSKEPISDAKTTSGETYIKEMGTGEAKRYELVFKAPGQAQEKPVEVTYKLGNGAASKEIRADVTVTAPPLTDVRTVLPGTETVLKQSTDLIEIDKQPLIGAAVVRYTDNPKTYSLAFLAPVTDGFQRTELTYHIGKQPARFEVLVSSNPWGAGYEAAFKVLFAAFVLAAVIEWALSVIFNWRWFLMLFDAMGIKTIISIVVSFVIVVTFKLDVLSELINILRNASYASSVSTQILSALLIAGGSASVNSLMVTLGMRSVRTAATLQDKPPPKKAWLAVKCYKNTSTDVVTVDVRFKKDGDTNFRLLGKLRNLRDSNKKFHWPIFRDNSRLPNYGGFSLEPGIAFWLELEGKGKNDASIPNTKIELGPYLPADGAIIDIEEEF